MSTIPQAQSQISEKPAPNAVTHAMDAKQKAADVDRKMRFYGVIQAFREGRYPDNKQIDDALKYTLAHSPVDVEKLSPDGKKLVQDICEIIETSRQIVLEKNAHEEFQNFLYASRKADIKGAINVNTPISKEEAKRDGETAGEAFRTLGKLILTNGEVRKLLSDLGLVGRDMFADLAVKAAELARPDEDALARVDQPAPENEFHDDIPNALQRETKRKQAENAANEAGQQAQGHADDVVNSTDPNLSAEENQARVADVAGNKLKQLKDKIPQKHKDLAKEHLDKTQNYVKEKFPKERRDQFVFRLKKVVVECQRHRDYQDAMEYFLTAFEQYKGHAAHIHGQVEENAGGIRGEGNVATAESSFRRLIERFANGRSTQPMFDALDQIYTDAKNDPELKDWFQRLDTYIRRVLQEPGFIMKDEANSQARQLTESGKKFFVAAEGRDQGKYVPHKDRLFEEVQTFFTGMGEDPLNKKFGEDWKRLTKDLFLDSEGNTQFKPHLWSDIRDPILPQLLQHVGYVPIPRIEYTDKMVDLVIENLTVEGQNLMPNILEIDARNYFKMSQYSKMGDVHTHSFKVSLAQIQSDMRDVQFYFNKKSGFPKVQDAGTADVFLGGNGLSVTVHLEAGSSPKGGRSKHVFTIKQVKAKVDKLNFAIRGSKHDVLYKVLRPLATGLIKKQICKAAEEGIREGLEKLDVQLVDLRDRMDEAKQAEGRSQMDVLKEKFAKSDKASSKGASNGSFKVVTSKRQSLLPALGHPEGWALKIEEREKAAVAGDERGWHSPAFSIVSPGQADPKNTQSAKLSGSQLAASSAAGGVAAGAGAAAATAAVTNKSANEANGANRNAGTVPTGNAPGVLNGTAAPGQTMAAPAIQGAGVNGTVGGAHKDTAVEQQPINPAFRAGQQV